MTLAASGAISASDIRTEFVGGSAAVDMASYYRGANTNVRANAANNTATNLAASVPTSGAISFSNFYSQAKGWQKTFSSNATQQSGTGIFGDDYAVDYPKTIIVNAGVTVYSTASGTPAIDLATGGSGTITVTNNGNIYGQGGAAGADGGTALKADVAITLNNNSGANLKGGGGGGGTGGTGGKGVYTANATFSSVVDEGGGGVSSPQNNTPSWFTIYSGDLDGRGVVSDRLWQGLNRQFPRGVGQPTQFQVRHTSGEGNGISGNCANRGPIYFSAQTNTTGVYTVSANISSSYGSGYGTPTISVSESTSSAGTSVSNSGTAGITASTTTYFTVYGTTAHQGTNSPNFYYNTLSGSVSGTCLATQTGGSGGSGGVGQGFSQSAGSGSSGSTGSNNAGNGGAGGAGGALGADGSTGSTGTNGSGTSVTFPASAPTNGVSGSAGGTKGYYILGQSNVSLTDNGTVAGRIG